MSFFDKTGTLTQGKMTVIDTWIHDPTWTIESCNRIAASLEANSEHFIGKAISALITNKNRLTVDNFRAFPGYGIRGVIAGRLYFLGNANFLKRNNIDIPGATAADRSIPPDRQGLTEVYLAGEESCLASYFISDTLRPEATTAIEKLRSRGHSISLVSGDHENVVRATASAVSIKQFFAEKLPQQKVEHIETLRQKGKIVAMVGDGINDAPALTAADVGFSVARGADIARGSAGIVLLREDLHLIPFGLALAAQTFTTIRQNLIWAFGYNLIVPPSACMGLLHPIFSAVAMALSSLCVVTNSLLLKKKYESMGIE